MERSEFYAAMLALQKEFPAYAKGLSRLTLESKNGLRFVNVFDTGLTAVVVMGAERARSVDMNSEADVARTIEDIRDYLLGGDGREDPWTH